MPDTERLEQRLAAVERAVVDGDAAVADLADLESTRSDLERLESRLEEFEHRIADLEGRTGALEGFTGEIRAVNDDVERQAATAVATVDRLERRLDALEEADGGVSESSKSADRADEVDSTDATDDADSGRTTSETEPSPGQTAERVLEPTASETSTGDPRRNERGDSEDEKTVTPADQRSVERYLERPIPTDDGDDRDREEAREAETNEEMSVLETLRAKL
ncbi:DUF7310 family coiled-coil domain-containing protein [Natronobacterium texcoconense]|uniref:DUF7310 domain-containing protein n=1 Tax=Natronobacterium texcoconense TaxID=1095778 RepID=A0A1H0YUU6_NATTX|nr:hypothetical protein [Natronobacterium texcoconense]SDQ18890.1 hypothetical protein SAMN04489842_0013 [Natronobacterium texcoconense]